MHWFQIGKGVGQGCILSPCLSNLYAEYIMPNAGLDETHAGIKISGRNINNLRYADNTTLMAGSEEELKSFLKKVKEESEKAGLKLNIQKTQITLIHLQSLWLQRARHDWVTELNWTGIQNTAVVLPVGKVAPSHRYITIQAQRTR